MTCLMNRRDNMIWQEVLKAPNWKRIFGEEGLAYLEAWVEAEQKIPAKVIDGWFAQRDSVEALRPKYGAMAYRVHRMDDLIIRENRAFIKAGVSSFSMNPELDIHKTKGAKRVMVRHLIDEHFLFAPNTLVRAVQSDLPREHEIMARVTKESPVDFKPYRNDIDGALGIVVGWGGDWDTFESFRGKQSVFVLENGWDIYLSQNKFQAESEEDNFEAEWWNEFYDMCKSHNVV